MNRIIISEGKKQKLIDRIHNSNDSLLTQALREAAYFKMKDFDKKTADSLYDVYLQKSSEKQLSDDLYKLITGAKGVDNIGTVTKLSEERHKMLYAKISKYIIDNGLGEYEQVMPKSMPKYGVLEKSIA